MGKLLYGIGINDAGYVVQINETTSTENGKRVKVTWRCPFYDRWAGMLKRCYSKRSHEKHPTYKECFVCDEWLTFSNFKAWMETQDWDGKSLDKDILVKNNKVYSPRTCVFVSAKVNLFITDRGADRGLYPIGVNYDKQTGKFKAFCSNGEGRLRYLGRFNTPEDAHEAWRKCKHEIALILAEEHSDTRIKSALMSRYANE